MNENQSFSLQNVADIFYLTSENATFSESDGILSLVVTDSGKSETYDRVFLHRAFPYDEPFSYLSVLNQEDKEIGIIRSLDDFDEETRTVLKQELDKKYFVAQIQKVHSVKERFGFSYWKVSTNAGEMEITFRDTYRSIVRLTPTHLFLTDSNANRYEIPDVDKLDRKSRRHIDIYL
ncbi:MAG: DUF1854 domain-containing protein [Ruminococcus sp.]|nr:DUF1854 domain-containing protein [Candidatus Apopatosoma intestinale]